MHRSRNHTREDDSPRFDFLASFIFDPDWAEVIDASVGKRSGWLNAGEWELWFFWCWEGFTRLSSTIHAFLPNCRSNGSSSLWDPILSTRERESCVHTTM